VTLREHDLKYDRLARDAERTVDGVAILGECLDLAEMLLSKNASYGGSVLHPVPVFAPDAPIDLKLRVRLDDKLNRLRTTGLDGGAGEDAVWDLMGYLVLLRIARRELPKVVVANDVTPAAAP